MNRTIRHIIQNDDTPAGSPWDPIEEIVRRSHFTREQIREWIEENPGEAAALGIKL